MLKSERVIIRLSPEEIDNLKKISEIENKSISVVLRDMIKFRYYYYLNKGKISHDQVVIDNINGIDSIDNDIFQQFKDLLG